MLKSILIFIFSLIFAGLLFANSSFVGYSGAPSSNGTCTSSCHAQNDFEPECVITGFPATYVPGQQYLISVHHNGTASINQFNCSIRIDEDSSIAGTIVGDYNTEVYNTVNETNGVHWQTTYTDSGSFLWTAPEVLTGPVTLYWSGLQGSRADGADQQIVIHATEIYNSVDYSPDLPEQLTLEQNYPNPFNISTSIELEVTQPGDITIEVANLLGQNVYSMLINDAQPGRYTIHWYGRDENGQELPSGTYFYRLQSLEGNLTRKMTLLR
jgi:hypothetical protein